jgi:uncharacterized protein YsxB (DUF464 family)
MITAVTTNEGNGVRITVTGHASEEFGDAERDQVCAAVSALLITLVSLTAGVWDGEGSGHVTCYLSKSQVVLAEFVVAGLQLLQDSYSEHITVQRGDDRLFTSQETVRWNKVTLPTLQPK